MMTTTLTYREINLMREELRLIERYRAQTEDNLRRLDNEQEPRHSTDALLEDLKAVRGELKSIRGTR